MTIRVGINGFGRIGRSVVRAVRAQNTDVEVVAANDVAAIDQMAHLLRFDSVYGRFPGEVRLVDGGIAVEDHVIRFLAEPEPKNLPWADLGVDVVISSGAPAARDTERHCIPFRVDAPVSACDGE